ncbi:flagellar hook assembly protein FlgD [Rhodobacter sp. KR11]|jgi:flagellar basal-body rod modification protein FlgD|uniref:flagellar hook capping FlgD N-terminal domain-containing protein n=1 Tax=Rhodobacter sp. KR11 TaxID=2974588 RepID=UPI00222312C9|nr:flagellar hook capping FlgD N-terminal domain-containing protein [Rhodobacter sp. KR11]MCW1919199.1 flagellar hook assembly protein FlgD [Rhodobacter sp. KR11]
MAVTATTSTPTTTTTPATTASTTAADNKKNYETFLKMMTTQIKNQDPLNPMDSDQLAVQLATFSQVEQQTKTNDLLTQMVSQNNLGAMGQMVGWVGKEAKVSAPVAFDGGTPVDVELAPRTGATKAVLVAKDGAGNIVSQTEVAVKAGTYEWQGLDTNGNPLPKGQYALSLVSSSATGELGTDTLSHYERVSEVRSGTGGINLFLANGTEVAASAVTAIREAVN